MQQGIDISVWQNPGSINYDQLEKNIDFAILRAGFTSQADGVTKNKDKYFDTHYQELSKRGVPLGAYWYSCATSTEQGIAEANYMLSIIKGKELLYPVYIDVEDDYQDRAGANATTSAIIGFCETMEKAGYYAGFYTNTNWYENKILKDNLKNYDCWLARWGESRPSYDHGIWQYSSTGKLDGYSGDLDMDYAYKDYPKIIKNMKEEIEMTTATKVITEAKKWIGTKQGDSNHKAIIDGYNSISPLPLGYKVTYADSWCDAFVSFVFKQVGSLALIGGGECGVERHIQIFKNLGIWIEDGTITPKAGDIITYNWDDATQPNDGFADHIGIVEKVSGTTITIIEGNIDYAVGRRTITVGNGYIRGYARPKYSGAVVPTPVKKSNTKIADEVIAGKWGTGADRKTKLQTAGYDYDAIQKIVNDKMAKPSKKTNEEIAKEVLAGKWGNGTDRKNKLTAAGYDYNAIQAIVNGKFTKPIAVGDMVTITANQYYTGQTIPPWVKSKKHEVSQISGDKVLLGFPNGICSWVAKSGVVK